MNLQDDQIQYCLWLNPIIFWSCLMFWSHTLQRRPHIHDSCCSIPCFGLFWWFNLVFWWLNLIRCWFYLSHFWVVQSHILYFNPIIYPICSIFICIIMHVYMFFPSPSKKFSYSWRRLCLRLPKIWFVGFEVPSASLPSEAATTSVRSGLGIWPHPARSRFRSHAVHLPGEASQPTHPTHRTIFPIG